MFVHRGVWQHVVVEYGVRQGSGPRESLAGLVGPVYLFEQETRFQRVAVSLRHIRDQVSHTFFLVLGRLFQRGEQFLTVLAGSGDVGLQVGGQFRVKPFVRVGARKQQRSGSQRRDE